MGAIRKEITDNVASDHQTVAHQTRALLLVSGLVPISQFNLLPSNFNFLYPQIYFFLNPQASSIHQFSSSLGLLQSRLTMGAIKLLSSGRLLVSQVRSADSLTVNYQSCSVLSCAGLACPALAAFFSFSSLVFTNTPKLINNFRFSPLFSKCVKVTVPARF